MHEQNNIVTSEPESVCSQLLPDGSTHRVTAQILTDLGECKIEPCIYSMYGSPKKSEHQLSDN